MSGGLRGGLDVARARRRLSGRNPFVDITAPERTSNFEGNLGGTIMPQKSRSHSQCSGRRRYDTPIATYISCAGKQSDAAWPAAQQRLVDAGLIDYALTKDQALRVRLLHNNNDREEPRHRRLRPGERAYSNESRRPVPPARDGSDRPTLLPQHAPPVAAGPISVAVGARGADDPRARWRDRGGAQVSGGRQPARVRLSSPI